MLKVTSINIPTGCLMHSLGTWLAHWSCGSCRVPSCASNYGISYFSSCMLLLLQAAKHDFIFDGR